MSDLPDPAEVGAASVPQTLPSTRAGGQDDVSSNKLPQIILLIQKRASLNHMHHSQTAKERLEMFGLHPVLVQEARAQTYTLYS